MDVFGVLTWIHILSATILFGTGIGTAFQMVWAMSAGRAGPVHVVASCVVTADWLFTLPAGIIQPLSGIGLAHVAGHSLTAPWLLATYACYAIAFLCWVPVVWLQIRIRNMTRNLPHDAAVPAEVKKLYRIWFILGWPAFGVLVWVFWLMISKPGFGT